VRTGTLNPDPKVIIQARLKAINMTQLQLTMQLEITPTLLDNALSDPLLHSEAN